MMVSAPHQSGFKQAMLRGRNWRSLSGLGQAGRSAGGGSRTTTTSSGPAGGSARLTSLSQRAAQTTPVQVVTRPAPGSTSSGDVSVTYACPIGLTYSGGVCAAMPTTQQQTQQASTPACPMGFLYVNGACVGASTQTAATTNSTSSTTTTTTATTQTTDWLPWILGGAAVLLLIGMSHR